jgi:hypothetical protein
MPVECSEITKGCDAVFRLILKDPDGNPVSLTGNKVEFSLRRSAQPCNPVVIHKDSDLGPGQVEILLTPNDNQALIKILPTDTISLEEGTYLYSIRVTFVSTGYSYVVASNLIDIVSSAFDTP